MEPANESSNLVTEAEGTIMGGKMTGKRDKRGEENKKQGREKKERDVQGGGGGKKGGGGGTKRSDRKS